MQPPRAAAASMSCENDANSGGFVQYKDLGPFIVITSYARDGFVDMLNRAFAPLLLGRLAFGAMGQRVCAQSGRIRSRFGDSPAMPHQRMAVPDNSLEPSPSGVERKCAWRTVP